MSHPQHTGFVIAPSQFIRRIAKSWLCLMGAASGLYPALTFALPNYNWDLTTPAYGYSYAEPMSASLTTQQTNALATFDTIYTRTMINPNGVGMSQVEFDEIMAIPAYFGLSRDPNGVLTGRGIVLDGNDNSPAQPNLSQPANFSGDFMVKAKRITELYKNASTAQAPQIEQVYSDLIEHFIDQNYLPGGKILGSGIKGTLPLNNGYNWVNEGPYTFRMLHKVSAEKRELYAMSIAYISGFIHLLKNDPSGSTDFYYNYYPVANKALAWIDNTPRKWQLMNLIRRGLDLSVIGQDGAPTDALCPSDGSMIHHGGHHVSYVSYSFGSVQSVHLNWTTAGIFSSHTPAAIERLRKVSLAWCFATTGGINPLHQNMRAAFRAGNAPDDGGAGNGPAFAQQSARLKSAYDGTPIAQDLEMAYAAIAKTGAGSASLPVEWRGLTLPANPAPDSPLYTASLRGSYGHTTNGTAIHRGSGSEQWYASLRGQPDDTRGGESYEGIGHPDQFNRKAMHGSLMLITTGKSGRKPNEVDSGYRRDGWNYSYHPNVTCGDIPLDQLLPSSVVWQTIGAIPATFAGETKTAGTATLRDCGVWMYQSNPSKKSAFFLGNRIVLVTNAVTGSNLHTGLIQTAHDTPASEPLVLDGASQTGDGSWTLAANGGHKIVDPKGNAYFIHPVAGTPAIKAQRGTQQCTYSLPETWTGTGTAPKFSSRTDFLNRINEFTPTSANYSRVWFDHGASATDQALEYTVLVKPQAGELDNYATAASNPATAPVTVTKTGKIHRFKDRATGTCAAAVFDTSEALAMEDVLAVNRKGSYIWRKEGNLLRLSMSSADAGNLTAFNLTLKGRWLVQSQENTFAVSTAPVGANTQLSLSYRDTAPQSLVLIAVDVDPDPDGDGFVTEFEQAVGSDPNSAASTPAPIYSDLMAWWKLDEISGNTAIDSSYSNLPGTALNSPSRGNGVFGEAMTLNGSNQSVQVPALNFSSNTVTISAWVKRNGAQAQWAGLFFERGLATGLNIGSNNELRYRWNDTSVAYDFTSGLVIPDNTWTFCALVVEPAKATLYMQPVGGAMQSAVNTAAHASHTFNATAYLGQDSLGGRFYKGSLDDVRVHARALTAQEVSTLRNTAHPVNQAPVFTVNPIGHPAATENAAYSGTLADFAIDPDASDLLSYSKVDGPAWLTIAANGTLSGAPSSNDVGANSFTVRVTDNTGRASDAVLNITVNNVNDAPVFTTNPITKPNANQVTAYAGTIAGSATDVDAGDTLTYSKVSGPAWLSVAANGTLTGTPSLADAGSNTFTVRVTDAGGLSADATLQISVIANGTWGNVSGGSWMTAANWNSGNIASGSDNTANFSTLNLNADAIVTLDGSRTIGNLVFGDISPSQNWTLSAGSGGDLTLDVASGTPSIGVNNQAATMSLALAGTKGLNKTGAGTLVLTGTNTYTGTTAVSAGILQLGDGVTNGIINGPYTIASGATLRLARSAKTTVANNSITGAGTLSLFVNGGSNGTLAYQWDTFTTFNSGFTGKLVVEEGRVSYTLAQLGGTTAIEIQPGAQFLTWKNNTYPQSISIAGLGWGETGYQNGGLRMAWGSGSATWAGPVTLTANSGIMSQGGGANFNITGAISGNYECLFYADDSGTLNVTPSGAVQNSYASTRINGGSNGVITAGNALAFSTGGLTVANATMKLNGFSFAFANLSGTGGKIGNYHASNAATLTVGGDNSDTTSATPMENGGAAALALTKVGAGTLTLTGVSTYTGATTVEAGTLAVTGSLGNTAVEVKSMAKLNVGGNLGGAVTVRANGRLGFAVAASSGAQAVRAISGALTFDSGSILDLSASATPAVGTYTLATASTISGTPSAVNLPARMNGSVAVVGGSLRLIVAESYSTWIATYNVGAKTEANADADMDGIQNAVEFVLGTAPNVSNAATLLAQKSGSNFVFTFNRVDASENGNLQLAVEAGTSLQTWSQVYQIGATTAASTGGVVVTENGTAPDTVTVSMPVNGAPACFARLKVTAE